MRQKRLKYLYSRDHGNTPDYPIQAFQRALTSRGVRHLNNDLGPLDFLGRALSKLKLMRRIADVSGTAYFAPIMQVSEFRLFPICYFAETIVYCMDVWQPRYDRWEAFFRRQRMRVAFITARISAERMRQRVAGLDAIWLPEAINPEGYDGCKPIAQRSVDILEIGFRRLDRFHDAVAGHEKLRRYNHVFQKSGQFIFADYADMVRGLGDTKISVCFPRSMTNPDIAGDVETMTLRYLESMASRCLVVGHCPEEMHDLFGYNPVIEADLSDPAGQLDAILSNLPNYAELIERNYRRMLEVATWDVRTDQLLALLGQRGYTIN